jgi:hypothetical protein
MPSTNDHGPKRAILYALVSSEEQAKSGHSLAQQTGMPREIVDAVRERIKENWTPSSAVRRFWALSNGIIYCGGCARRMGYYSVLARSKKYHYRYCRCPGHHQHLEGCPQGKSIRSTLGWSK